MNQTIAICIIAAWLHNTLFMIGRGRAAEGRKGPIESLISAGHMMAGIVFGDFVFQLLLH
jgi:hypothetical protein